MLWRVVPIIGLIWLAAAGPMPAFAKTGGVQTRAVFDTGRTAGIAPMPPDARVKARWQSAGT
ncbi:hypothetical protein QTI66_15830 [Variovorax sp. J22R133]|uniref:hypothetical protein n=1 Tax=Variovorax brevis TaxID=3053503 RepID=UPI0025769028|nr:hypothetical protein [Variovorax sp. J22R133]MDM0113628.1 hypothetical protein [Variovorax sp. J22R133]